MKQKDYLASCAMRNNSSMQKALSRAGTKQINHQAYHATEVCSLGLDPGVTV